MFTGDVESNFCDDLPECVFFGRAGRGVELVQRAFPVMCWISNSPRHPKCQLGSKDCFSFQWWTFETAHCQNNAAYMMLTQLLLSWAWTAVCMMIEGPVREGRKNNVSTGVTS